MQHTSSQSGKARFRALISKRLKGSEIRVPDSIRLFRSLADTDVDTVQKLAALYVSGSPATIAGCSFSPLFKGFVATGKSTQTMNLDANFSYHLQVILEG